MRATTTAAALILSAAPAQAANPAPFLNLCEATVPVASCGCMANELQRSRDGQIALDAYAGSTRPAAEKQATIVALANKYGMKISEMMAAVERAKPLAAAAAERCK